jgi:hypothetical protein
MRTTLELPEETYASSRQRTVGMLLVLVLFMAVTANFAMVGILHWYHLRASTETEVVTGKWRHLSSTEERYDILLVGDSSGLIGVDPRVISERTGLSCYNACGFGNLLVVNESWLIQHLETLDRLPRIVVSLHVPDIWGRSEGLLRQQLNLFPGEVRPWERYRPIIKPPRESLRQRINHWFPMFRTPLEARMALVALGLTVIGRGEVRTDDLGLSRLPAPDPARAVREAQRYLDRLKLQVPTSDDLSKVNREAYEAMLDVLEQQGSRLMAAEAPTVDLLSKDPLYLEHLERNRTLLTRVARGRAGFKLAATGRSGFSATNMQNPDHIAEADTRAYFSGLVADHLVKAIAEWNQDTEAP